MTLPIRVFVGSSARYVVEETVFVQSLLEQASRSVEVNIIDCGSHRLRRVGSSASTPLPEAWKNKLAGGTEFSFARFGVPELCGYQGRAIYCEPDQLLFSDISELWDYPLGEGGLAAVPFSALRGDAPTYQGEGYLSSVLLFDCARCPNFNVTTIADSIEQNLIEYRDAISLTDRCVDLLGSRITPLPACWNDLDRKYADTRLLHFTDGQRQPWRYPNHREGNLWNRAYLSSIDSGRLDDGMLDTALRLGGISRRVRTLPRLPPSIVRPVSAVWQSGEALDSGLSNAYQVCRRGGAKVARRVRHGIRRRIRGS